MSTCSFSDESTSSKGRPSRRWLGLRQWVRESTSREVEISTYRQIARRLEPRRLPRRSGHGLLLGTLRGSVRPLRSHIIFDRLSGRGRIWVGSTERLARPRPRTLGGREGGRLSQFLGPRTAPRILETKTPLTVQLIFRVRGKAQQELEGGLARKLGPERPTSSGAAGLARAREANRPHCSFNASLSGGRSSAPDRE